MNRYNSLAYGLITVGCLWLSACENSRHPAPVVDRWNKVNSTQRVYVVQAGDTIYSIAWRFGKTFQSLAAYNHLVAPYTVHPGQRLKVAGEPASKVATVYKLKDSEVKAKPVDHSPPVTAKAAAPVSAKAADSGSPTLAKGIGSLPWPLKGPIIGQFGQHGNKGIDIAVAVGTEMKAVDSGTVVYAGDNLHGYGQLVIIKHNNDLMTAYAHNSKLMVKEGAKVTAGQVIALSGDSEAPKAMLHFELRQAGRPKNPLNFLN